MRWDRAASSMGLSMTERKAVTKQGPAGNRRVAGYVTYVKAAPSRRSVRSGKSPTDCSKSRQGEGRI